MWSKLVRSHHRCLIQGCCAALALLAFPASAVELGSAQVTPNAPARTTVAPTSSASPWTASDSALAQLWGLSVPEVQRARLLMQGPRGAFSSPQLSPIEALGIHARTDAERDRYARLFAQVSYDDTQRVLAWSRVAQAELQRLTAGQPVLNFKDVPKAAVSTEAADMLGIPRTAVVPPPRRTAAKRKPAAASGSVVGQPSAQQGVQPPPPPKGR